MTSDLRVPDVIVFILVSVTSSTCHELADCA